MPPPRLGPDAEADAVLSGRGLPPSVDDDDDGDGDGFASAEL